MKNILTLTFALFVCSFLTAQQYISTPVQSFSFKKAAYITMNDGTEIEGQLKGVKRKKGLFERITLKMADGSKKKIEADLIKSMYLPQSGIDKFATAMDKMNDIETFDASYSDVNLDHMKDGYAYFETTNAQIRKKKEGVVMMQLLNVSACSKVKVFFDPYAQETASIGVAGMDLVGGDAKSYFVKIGDEKAFRLKKKDYKDMFEEMYEACPDFVKSVDKIKWTELGEHVYTFTGMCN